MTHTTTAATELTEWLESRTSHTTRTAALALGTTTGYINQLCKAGKLAYTMHGRDRSITKEEIDRYRRERRKRGRPPKITPQSSLMEVLRTSTPMVTDAELKRRYRRISKAFKALDDKRETPVITVEEI